ncbi:hypothetical protein [Acidisoma sp.]|uniref:hypothetical protein n=1 Tax=Acidisoma sp. TaxID=1872115 RepID=UPI003AFFFC30
MSSVLAVGIYLADRPHAAGHLLYELAGSRAHEVTQRWTALAPGGAGYCDLPCTVAIEISPAPKFSLIDAMTHDADNFDWVFLCDDDIEVPADFIDNFIELAERFDFALCQPARTTDSYIDHGIVARMAGLSARRTRFVEIGPLVAIRRDAMPLLLPFGNDCGMGWGLDFIWPGIIEEAGLRMGIIDAVPVAHRMRKPVTGYDHGGASRAMFQLMAAHPHLPREQAFTVLEAYV